MAAACPTLEKREPRSHDLAELIRQWFIDCADLAALDRQLKAAAADVEKLDPPTNLDRPTARPEQRVVRVPLLS